MNPPVSKQHSLTSVTDFSSLMLSQAQHAKILVRWYICLQRGGCILEILHWSTNNAYIGIFFSWASQIVYVELNRQ